MKTLVPIEFVGEALLGRLSDDEIKRCGNKVLAACALIRRNALLAGNDDLAVRAGDALRGVLPSLMFFNRPMPQHPHR